MQNCSACGVMKPLSAFHRDKSKPRGVASTCKECAIARARRWLADNAERSAKSSAAWYAANRTQRLDAMKQYRVENYEACIASHRRWLKDNKARKRDVNLVWRSANIHKVRLYRRVSESRRRSVEGSHTADDINRIRGLQRNRCAICRDQLADDFHEDHIQPLAKGGSNWPQNIQLLCAPCNREKHARDPIDHMQSLGRLL